MRSGAWELDELQHPGVINLAEADGTTASEELHHALGAVGQVDGLVLDVDALLDPAPIGAPRLTCTGSGCGDPVDRDDAEIPQETLVVGASKRGVIDQCLGSTDMAQPLDGGHGSLRFPAFVLHEGSVEDDPGPLLGPTGGEEDELGPPRRLPGAFEVEVGVRLVAKRSDLAGGAVEACIARLCLIQGRDHLAVAVDNGEQSLAAR